MDERVVANDSAPGSLPEIQPETPANLTAPNTANAGLSNKTTAAPTPAGTYASEEEERDYRDAIAEKHFEKHSDEIGGYEPIKTTSSRASKPHALHRGDGKINEDELFRALSRRRTGESLDSQSTQEEQLEIERLMSRMFGRTRQANSVEEKTRHVGVVFKNLTVKGMGLGAALQPTVGDIFLTIPRAIKGLFSKQQVARKPPVRELLSDFTGCIKPGEMVLVLGRPGSGCSTFLKVLGNQRFGYVAVEGEVTYGGTDAKIMGRDFRGEV